METVNRKKIVDGTVWKGLEIIFQKGSSLVISIVLARLLAADLFGIIAITTIFINFADIFIQNGFNVALIRGENVNSKDYSTAIIMSLSISGILYAIFYFFSPVVADYYHEPILTIVLRLLMITLFFKAISSVIKADATRKLKMKPLSICTVIANIIGGGIGIVLALLDYGIWALVFQQIITSVTELILLVLTVKWRITIVFSMESARKMLHFSKNVILSGIIEYCGNSVSTFFTGKIYSIVDLGYLRKGASLPETLGGAICNTANSIVLPTLSSRQDNEAVFLQTYRKVMCTAVYLVFPVMGLLLVISPRLIPLLLTAAWNPIIPIVQWNCAIQAFNLIRVIDLYALYALGYSKDVFISECIRCFVTVVSVVCLLLVFKVDLYTFIAIESCITLVLCFLLHFFVKKRMGYDFRTLCTDLGPNIIIAFIACICAYPIVVMGISNIFCICIQSLLVLLIYLLLSKLFRINIYRDVVSIVKSRIKRV